MAWYVIAQYKYESHLQVCAELKAGTEEQAIALMDLLSMVSRDNWVFSAVERVLG